MASNKITECTLRKPHEISEKFGNLTATICLKYPDNFPKTCTAMAKVAQAGARSDKARISGHDDYSIPLETLMNAFDVFVREYTGKSKTGNLKNYDILQSCELTLLLIWNIRHTWTHNGSLIDEKCKASYEKILSQSKGVKPIECLPTKLKIDYEFSINYSNYRSIIKCVFDYIKSRVKEEDYKVLLTRSSITDIGLSECRASLPIGHGSLWFDVAEAHKYGIYIDTKTGIVESPEGSTYCLESEKIILPNGESFPAIFIPNVTIDVPNDRVNLKKLFEIISLKTN
jgi:hypothetical protein